MSPRLRHTIRALLSIGILLCLIVVLHGLGRFGLRGPEGADVESVRRWLQDPVVVVATIIRWLALFLPLRSLSQAPLNGLLGLGRIKPRLVALLTASATSLIAYLVLIPYHSWKGAVMGTIGSEVVLIVLGWGLLVVYQRRHDRSLGLTPVAEQTV